MEGRIGIKNIEPILVACIEGNGQIRDMNKDIDKLYTYLYCKGFKDKIGGPLIGLFYTEFGGKYMAAVPVKEEIPVEDRLQIKTLSKMKCVSSLHKGSYKTIDETFNRLRKYLKENNLEWYFPVREIYIKSDGAEDDYLTEIQMPIEETE